MARTQGTAATNPPEPSKIHAATLASGASGAVLKGAEIDVVAAVALRRAGRDIVVCGEDGNANRRLAFAIESTVGPCRRGDPHIQHAGPYALPHYQQDPKPPLGHSFYEIGKRKARQKP